MSTKMKEAATENGIGSECEKDIDRTYHGRIQPKYYLKYTKSLEKNKHGIISAVIIYKMLLYFIESDFNLNDDYVYNMENARQFYIRREILRSIASHTCSDIYNIKNTTFSSLLFICDEMQEWGRKSWNDLYTNVNPDSVVLSINTFDSQNIEYSEKIIVNDIKEEQLIIDNIVSLYSKQFDKYQLIFRDGQDTNSRTFNLKKTIYLNSEQDDSENNNITVTFKLLAKGKNEFEINLTDSKLDKRKVTKVFCDKLNINTLPEIISIIK